MRLRFKWCVLQVALMIASTTLFGCQGNTKGPGAGRPDLGVAEDTVSMRAVMSLRELVIRNRSQVSGEGTVSITVVDSVGTPLMAIPLRGGIPLKVPAASLGGLEGRVVSISGPPQFERLVDSLARTGSRFGLQARIRTIGGDEDETDNVKTQEWGPWWRLVPGDTVTLKVRFVVPAQVRSARVRLDTLRLPSGAHLVGELPEDGSTLSPGLYWVAIQIHASDELLYGSVLGVRLTLMDPLRGVVLQQHDVFAVYDTVPPMLSNYRAVLLQDGRIAIQVDAGDENSGVVEGGVESWYSVDGGSSWHHQAHGFIEDGFGRPTRFEVVVGPFPHGARVLLGVRAMDAGGNMNTLLPRDAAVFVAPANAERLLGLLGVADPEGNPLFRFTVVASRVAWLPTAWANLARSSARYPRTGLSLDATFERRRLQELDKLPAAFREHGVEVVGFRRLHPSMLRITLQDGSTWSVFRLRGL